MRHPIKTLIFCILTCLIALNASAQDSWPNEAMQRYTALHPLHAPLTHAMAYKGQLRLNLGIQAMKSKSIAAAPGSYVSPAFFTDTETSTWGPSHTRLSAHYTPWEHITLGATFTSSSLSAGTENFNNIAWFLYSEHSACLTSAAYHKKFSDYFAYEGQYSLGLGNGKLLATGLEIKSLFFFIIPLPTEVEYHNLTAYSYSFVNQNLSGGISVYTGKRLKHLFQGTFMLNMGYTRYFNFEHDNTYAFWSDVGQRLRSNPNVLSLTPSLIFTVNTPYVFSAQFNISRPITWLDGSPYSPAFSFGVQLSFRILKSRIFPKPDSE